MFEIVIDLFYIGKGFTTEPVKQCSVAWKKNSATELERFCESTKYETVAECAVDAREARKFFLGKDGLEMARKQKAVPLMVRCLEIGEKIA